MGRKPAKYTKDKHSRLIKISLNDVEEESDKVHGFLGNRTIFEDSEVTVTSSCNYHETIREVVKTHLYSGEMGDIRLIFKDSSYININVLIVGLLFPFLSLETDTDLVILPDYTETQFKRTAQRFFLDSEDDKVQKSTVKQSFFSPHELKTPSKIILSTPAPKQPSPHNIIFSSPATKKPSPQNIILSTPSTNQQSPSIIRTTLALSKPSPPNIILSASTTNQSSLDIIGSAPAPCQPSPHNIILSSPVTHQPSAHNIILSTPLLCEPSTNSIMLSTPATNKPSPHNIKLSTPGPCQSSQRSKVETLNFSDLQNSEPATRKRSIAAVSGQVISDDDNVFVEEGDVFVDNDMVGEGVFVADNIIVDGETTEEDIYCTVVDEMVVDKDVDEGGGVVEGEEEVVRGIIDMEVDVVVEEENGRSLQNEVLTKPVVSAIRRRKPTLDMKYSTIKPAKQPLNLTIGRVAKENHKHSAKCRVCGCSFENTKACFLHEVFKCNMFGKETENSAKLKLTESYNISNIDRPKKQQCEFCSKRFASKSLRLLHQDRVHKLSKPDFVCNICEKVYSSANFLKNHLMTHVETQDFICDICAAAFRSKNGLVGHQAKDHGNNDDDKRFPCQFCERVFKFPAQLSQHERIHTKEKPFKCEICTKKFSAKCNLKSHMEIHKDLEERRFRCSLCPHGATSQVLLDLHMNSHTGKRPYVCSDCGASYKRPSNLRRHRVSACSIQLPFITKQEPRVWKDKSTLLSGSEHDIQIHTIQVLDPTEAISDSIDIISTEEPGSMNTSSGLTDTFFVSTGVLPCSTNPISGSTDTTLVSSGLISRASFEFLEEDETDASQLTCSQEVVGEEVVI